MTRSRARQESLAGDFLGLLNSGRFVLLLSIGAALILLSMAPASAGARAFTPEFKVSVDSATADTAPALTQTLKRKPVWNFGWCEWWYDLWGLPVDCNQPYGGQQPLKEMTMVLPKRWRVNGEAQIEPCALPQNAIPETVIDESLCPANGSGVVGTVTAYLGEWPEGGGDPPSSIPGKVYYVSSADYYGNEKLGNRADWVKQFPDGKGAALPVVLAIQLDLFPDTCTFVTGDSAPACEPTDPFNLPPIYMESVLSGDSFRIRADANLDNPNFATEEIPPLLTAFVGKMDLSLQGGDQKGLFRTPVKQQDACAGNQAFSFNATSFSDERRLWLLWLLDWLPAQYHDGEQTVNDQLANLSSLTGCDKVSAPFAPRVSVSSSTTEAGKNPDLTVKIDRDGGNAYLTDMKMTLPEGMVGSPYATSTLCSDAEAKVNNCPADAKVAEAKMQVDVFESREVEMKANVYNASVTGSELARFLTVIKGPPIAGEQIVVLPVTLNVLPGVKGLEATVSGMPPEFDVRHVEFLFKGSTGVDRGHPLLINPNSCNAGSISVDFGSEMGQTHTAEAPYQATDCDAQPYNPKLDVSISCTEPHCAPAITARVTQASGDATTQDTRISFPSSFVLNTQATTQPCSAADVSANTCPESTRMGTVSVDSPLAEEPLAGNIYLAEPAEGDTSSIRRIHAEVTGLISMGIDTSLVANEGGGFDAVMSGLPQVPISSIELKMDGGTGKALVMTPYECGPHQFNATFTSHSGKVVENTSAIDINGGECAPTMSARLKPDNARAHPRLDLIVRPNQGTAPLKKIKVKLGSGKKKLKLRAVRLTRDERRSAARRCKSRRSKNSRKSCRSRQRPSLKIGLVRMKTQSGKKVSARLKSKGGWRVYKSSIKKKKDSDALSLKKVKFKLRRGKIIITRLPEQTISELVIRIYGNKRKLLTNPKRKGTVTFKGYFTTTDGERYTAKAKDKVRSVRKKRSQKR